MGKRGRTEGPKLVSEISNGATSTKALTREEAAILIRELELKQKKSHVNGACR